MCSEARSRTGSYDYLSNHVITEFMSQISTLDRTVKFPGPIPALPNHRSLPRLNDHAAGMRLWVIFGRQVPRWKPARRLYERGTLVPQPAIKTPYLNPP